MHQSTYYLSMPTELIEPTIKRLRMFVLRSKVKVENVSTQFIRVGIAGNHASRVLADAKIATPQVPDEKQSGDHCFAIRLPGTQARFELFGRIDAMSAIWKEAKSNAQLVGHPAWKLMDIYAGIPTVYATTTEAFVPQMVNLQLVGGVSFTKGCYPGQEIVARMHYLGQLKKRMYRIHIETQQAPKPGDNVYEATTENEQSIGQIVDAQPSPYGGFDALAVLQIASAEQHELHFAERSGPKSIVRELPYAFA